MKKIAKARSKKILVRLEQVKKFLTKNEIEFVVPKNAGLVGHSDIYIPKYRVCIRAADEDKIFFKRHKKAFYPIFIRTDEHAYFIYNKIRNTILRSMTTLQTAIMKAAVKRAKAETQKTQQNPENPAKPTGFLEKKKFNH